MPKWRNNILVQAPVAPDDHAVAALLTTVAQHGRTILLFADSRDLQGVATQARGGAGISAAGGLTVLVCDNDHTASKAYASQPDGSWEDDRRLRRGI